MTKEFDIKIYLGKAMYGIYTHNDDIYSGHDSGYM